MGHEEATVSAGWGGRAVMLVRAQWQPRIDAGDVDCARCGLPILHGQRWDVGHTVDRALGGTSAHGLHPEHARCNRAAGGRLAQQLRRPRPPRPVVVPAQQRRTWL